MQKVSKVHQKYITVYSIENTGFPLTTSDAAEKPMPEWKQ